MPLKHRVQFLLIAAVISTAGCGGNDIPFANVEGQLLVNGAPVKEVQIEFFPKTKGPRSIGLTDDQGRFTLKADDGQTIGAVVGTHKVVLRDLGNSGDKFLGRAADGVDMTNGKKPRVSDAYADAVRTPLEKEVSPGKCVIELSVPAPSKRG